ncbi:MAG: DUF805 domain-containing protein [Terracidiphilus sp.]|jgi:uncharacterized membrane protein YhaH (DUF805 family)
MDWYVMVWQRFAEFDGRSRRKEYWMFALFNFLICLGLLFIGILFFKHGGFVLCLVYELAQIIPSLAVSVRRLHDIGKSGWWLLIALIPFLGGLILFVFTILDSEPGPNEYGPNPKYPEPYTMLG